MSMTDNIRILQLADMFAGALTPWVGQPVVVYLKHVSRESIAGVPQPPPGQYPPCPPYPPAPAPTPGAGGPGITGGTPIVPGSPGGSGNVGPITGSPIGSTALWGCLPEPHDEHGETAVVAGTLRFVGADYLIVGVPRPGGCTDLLIPFTAIGMIVMGYLS